ncbi:hypothetical protein BXZ70DRAFT_222151 [Cristinia sonorae]|uniref:DUF7704 domain-containing protein n=1 Tax=Cristinia sonorae TaxID=1940300 RepID=A0A8K0UND5_9AGAR|nr:hypothetical protein BXZ70DRAFT_222151 [Cristinia sonorae]
MSFKAPWIYRLFFLYIEPVSALVGSYYAAALPWTYLALLSPRSNGNTPPQTADASVLVSLYQLSNLYLLFALNEHLVLSSTSSLTTWRRLLFCLLVADFGHLATMFPLAAERTSSGDLLEGIMRVYARFWEWNAMDWGSVGFVYCGALMRISFLLGWGLRHSNGEEEERRSIKTE